MQLTIICKIPFQDRGLRALLPGDFSRNLLKFNMNTHPTAWEPIHPTQFYKSPIAT